MALFGRGRRKRDDEEPVGTDLDAVDHDDDDFPGAAEAPDGPYDQEHAPEDEVPRLDLGSLLLPVPDGAQLQVEMDPSGPVKAVHVLTPVGQLTLNAYAAPRSGGLWREICGELAQQLRSDGAVVRSVAGEWGQELAAALGEVTLRFIGVDGPRWMLRGVVASPNDLVEHGIEVLQVMVRNTVVVRGQAPMPVRTPLQIDLPRAIAEHIAQSQAAGQQPG